MRLLAEAYALAADVHRNQIGKDGRPYFEHCFEVARRARKQYFRLVPNGPDVEKVQVVAILHDAFEDFPRENEHWEMELHGFMTHVRSKFGDEIYDALNAITKQDGEPYAEYIERVAKDWIARLVKLCDLSHNLEAWRLPPGVEVEKHLRSRDRYHRAFIRLWREL